MWWRRPSPLDPRLDDLIELLGGVATILMAIDSKLDDIKTLLEER
jgi:hypothetical protein